MVSYIFYLKINEEKNKKQIVSFLSSAFKPQKANEIPPSKALWESRFYNKNNAEEREKKKWKTKNIQKNFGFIK